MKQLDFEPREFAERLRRARVALQEHAVDAMIVHDPANVFWLTGWRGKGYQMYQPLIVTAEDTPLTLLTRTSDVPEALNTGVLDDVHGWRTEAGEDPVAILGSILQDRGLLGKRLA